EGREAVPEDGRRHRRGPRRARVPRHAHGPLAGLQLHWWEMTKPRRRRAETESESILEGVDASLLDIVDHVLTKGVVVTGDLMLGVADIDLVYLRVSAVLCAADRILGPEYSSRRRTGNRTPTGRLPPMAKRMK